MNLDAQNVRLDDLYRMIAYIYSDKNTDRTATATFAHFVEVCGMLTIHDRKKKREGLDVTEALCKALGWYFPLLAKMRIQSVEALVFRKFPLVCPYCRSAPHKEAECKLVRGTSPTVNHEEVTRFFQLNWEHRPKTLNGWQEMFQAIYPRSLEEHGRSTIGLLEELGELSEAVRVFELHPKYFLGEAADTFSYIMGIANEHAIRCAQDGSKFSFQEEFLSRYPGLCMQCGSRLCTCPAVPEATVGRMAKELDVIKTDSPFIVDTDTFAKQGREVGHKVLEALGGYAGLSAGLPFDRGDTNQALVAICLKIADAVESENRDLAENLRAEALKLNVNAQKAGSPRKPIEAGGLFNKIETAWKELDDGLKKSIRATAGLVGEIGEILDTVRVLFVSASPINEQALRVNGELRAIQGAIESNRAKSETNVVLDILPAATPTDFRRRLLDRTYDLIHFAGHADQANLVFESETGEATPVAISAIAEIVGRTSTKGVILNACDSAKALTTPISPFTIGMDDSMDDDAAIEFSRGFYDAIVRNRSVEEAYQEGLSAAQMAGHQTDHIRMVSKDSPTQAVGQQHAIPKGLA